MRGIRETKHLTQATSRATNQKCEECGTDFPRKRWWQRFCSPSCRSKHWFLKNFTRVTPKDR